MTTYTITRVGYDAVEAEVEAFDPSDALNRFADQLEALDVPAFWHQEPDGTPYLLAAGDRYVVRA